MKNEIDFTIITPVYNGERWVKETIESVLLNCEQLSYEYIVVDDGSTDLTPLILSNFGDKLKVLQQINQGEAKAVNYGLNMAKGEFVVIVSADDPVRTPQLFINAKNMMDNDRSLVCVYPDWSVIDSHSRVIRNVEVSEYSENVLIGEFNCIVGPGGVFRRSIALEIGGRNPRYKFTSDYDFWLRLSRCGGFKRIPGFFAYWREHPDSTSIALRGLAMANERIEVMENFLETNKSIPKYLARMAKGHAYMGGALLVYFDRAIPAKKLLFKALVKYPKGLWKFDSKEIIYIVLLPISSKLLSAARKIGLFRNMPTNA